MDPSNILFWNVRGLNGIVRQDVVRNLVISSKIDVVCLQETKMEDISRINVIQMFGRDFSNFIFLPLVRASGGILLVWRDRLGHHGGFRVEGSLCFSPIMPSTRTTLVVDVCLWSPRQRG
jgi:exonuclease III